MCSILYYSPNQGIVSTVWRHQTSFWRAEIQLEYTENEFNLTLKSQMTKADSRVAIIKRDSGRFISFCVSHYQH